MQAVCQWRSSRSFDKHLKFGNFPFFIQCELCCKAVFKHRGELNSFKCKVLFFSVRFEHHKWAACVRPTLRQPHSLFDTLMSDHSIKAFRRRDPSDATQSAVLKKPVDPEASEVRAGRRKLGQFDYATVCHTFRGSIILSRRCGAFSKIGRNIIESPLRVSF